MRPRVATTIVVLVAGTSAACTLLTPFGTDLTSGDSSPDASDAQEATPVADAAPVDAVGDGDGDGGPCVPGSRTAPVRVFDPSPTPGFSCSIENVVEEDGKVAGLDRGSTEAPLGGTNVTGCVGVELASAVDQVTVRAQPTAQGCLTRCSNNCGTGHDFAFFAGPSPDAFTRVTGINMTSTALADYVVPIPADGIRFFAVCRTPNGDSRDDIAVDAIHGRCR